MIWVSICDSGVSTARIDIAVSASESRYNINIADHYRRCNFHFNHCSYSLLSADNVITRIRGKFVIAYYIVADVVHYTKASYESNRNKILHAAEHTQQT
jgi:hypothetical protein